MKRKLLVLSSLILLAFQQACTSDEQAVENPVAATDNFGVSAPSSADKENAFTPVYFPFDSSLLLPESSSNVLSVSEHMKKNPAQALRIDGHCDERGTEQYNIALGMRRAEAVKKALVSEGVTEAQITTNSFGKERPAVQGHDEAAWKMNRRAEFSLVAGATK